jgi:hypothetical protein
MRKPAYVPADQKCACGCEYPKRKNSKYASDRCRDDAWSKRNPGKAQASLDRFRAMKASSKQPPPHECVFVQYGSAEPFCFKCFFYNQRIKSETRIPATDEAVRLRANLSRDKKGK